MTDHTMIFGDDGSQSADVAWLWVNSHSWPGWAINVVSADVPAFVRVVDDAPAFADGPRPRHPGCAGDSPA